MWAELEVPADIRIKNLTTSFRRCAPQIRPPTVIHQFAAHVQGNCKVKFTKYHGGGDNFASSIASQQDNYKELHFNQDGAPPHFCASCFVRGLTTILPVGELCAGDQQNGFRYVPITLHVIYFCRIRPPTPSKKKRRRKIKTKHIL